MFFFFFCRCACVDGFLKRFLGTVQWTVFAAAAAAMFAVSLVGAHFALLLVWSQTCICICSKWYEVSGAKKKSSSLSNIVSEWVHKLFLHNSNNWFSHFSNFFCQIPLRANAHNNEWGLKISSEHWPYPKKNNTILCPIILIISLTLNWFLK